MKSTKTKATRTASRPRRCLFSLLASSAIVNSSLVDSFSTTPNDVRHRVVDGARMNYRQAHHRLSMALPVGSGMGMAGGGKKKSGPSSSSRNNNKGMGSRGSSSTTKSDNKPYDVAKAWIKSQKLYDELMHESTRAFNAANPSSELLDDDVGADITTEYIVAARCRAEASGGGGGNNNNNNINSALRSASDWIPVAQICVVRPIEPEGRDGGRVGSSDDGSMSSLPVRAAVSYYCREIFFAATLASPALKSLPRNLVEYSAEPVDSWIRHVYEDVIEGKAADSYVDVGTGTKVGMTKGRAREVLGLDVGCNDASLIKSAYKRESMACHPDRFVNTDRTREEIDAYTEKFGLVKMAYEALNSGVRENNAAATTSVVVDGDDSGVSVGGTNGASSSSRRSWYESLGGRSRTDFVGPIDLMSMDKASALFNKAFRSAVVGLDPDLTNAFVLRNQQAAAAAAARSSK
ncbi:hypothetical protein ACHAXA_010205 [Cyclostephanos tholiformis]|uniref:J domain-containing protein n=1 Tax=Cyclostephanos tholiformis TaxID=382380 RepID=A0ABD3SFX5_9STRA